MNKISVASLGNPVKAGFLTKQGGSIKTWKKRWFVLKGDTLWYFKTQKDQDVTGSIKLEPNSVCQMEVSKKKKNCYFFSVSTSKRVFYIYSETEQAAKEWVDAIHAAINERKNSASTTTLPATSSNGNVASTPAPPADQEQNSSAAAAPTPASDAIPTTTTTAPPAAAPQAGSTPKDAAPSKTGADISPRHLIAVAKGVIPFLQDEDTKVLEFWQIWSESIPPIEDVNATSGGIEYQVSTSANMQKLTWRTAGPQNVFIQRMVDFFWNVGAPESEIDRLNDVGALINPMKIGSWIDMSSKGGMDGGWFFPVEIPLKMAIEAADPGEPSKKVTQWSEKHTVDKCFSVGRDMGAAPPRQTELRIKLPGNEFEGQLVIALDAFTIFDFPEPPASAMDILRKTKPTGLCLSVITSSEGFVRLGLMIPKPSMETVLSLCSIAGATNEELAAFEGSLGTEGPQYVEYQFLKEGFGYGVYKEGFDIVFHYFVGEEVADG